MEGEYGVLIWKTKSFSREDKKQYLLFLYVKVSDEYYYHTIFDERGMDYIGACSKEEHDKMMEESDEFLGLTEEEFIKKFEGTKERYNEVIEFSKRQIDNIRKDFEKDSEDMRKYLLKNYVIGYLNGKVKKLTDEMMKIQMEILRISEMTKGKTKLEVEEEERLRKIRKIIESNKSKKGIGIIENVEESEVKDGIKKINGIDIGNLEFNKFNEENKDLFFREREEKEEMRKIIFNIIKKMNKIIVEFESKEIDEDIYEKRKNEILKNTINEFMESNVIKEKIEKSQYKEIIKASIMTYCNSL